MTPTSLEAGIEHKLWRVGATPDDQREWVRTSYDSVLPYVQECLAAPHPHRPGPVCPYIPRAVNVRSVFFAAGSLQRESTEFLAATRTTITSFLRVRDASTPAALIIVLPDEYPVDYLLDIHADLKLWCIERYLMAGVLYPASDAWSLHSHDFFPLRTPVPTLVIRDMALFDMQFMISKPYRVRERLAFLCAYTRCFADASLSNREEVVRAKRLLRRYRRLDAVGRAASIL